MAATLPAANVRREGDTVIKTLSDPTLAQREYRILKKLHHPNICTAVHVEGVELVMPYGGPDLLAKRRDNVRLVFAQIASAVAYLHAAGYAHSDLKPENVVCDDSEHVRLVDFGSSMLQSDRQSRGRHVRVHGARALAAQGVRHPADVRSSGVVLFASGTTPFPLQGQGGGRALRRVCAYGRPPAVGPHGRNVGDRRLGVWVNVDPDARGTGFMRSVAVLEHEVAKRQRRV